MATLSSLLTPAGVATQSGAETLLNKTIAFADNLLTGVASTSTNQTLTNKTYQGSKEVRVAMSTGTNMDLSAGNYFAKTATTNTAFTVSNVPAAGTSTSFVLDLTNGGAFTMIWMTGTKWVNGIAPVLTVSGRDVLGFFTHDGGTTWNGLVLGKDLK